MDDPMTTRRAYVALGVALFLLVRVSMPPASDVVRNVSPWGWLFGGQPLVAAYIPNLIKLQQRGTATIAGGATLGTSAVTAVVVANSDLRYLGCTYSAA